MARVKSGEGKKKKQSMTGPVKVFIVQCLARFKRPSEIVEMLLDDYGLSVTRQAIAKYDPTKVNGQKLSKTLKTVFEEARAEFVAEVGDIDIAHEPFLLRELSDLYWKAKEEGKDVAAAGFLEMAKKIRSGYWTNRREISGPKGGPIQHAGLTVEDWQKQASARLAGAEEALGIFDDET